MTCPRCKVLMVDSKALDREADGIPDFPELKSIAASVVTMSKTGPAYVLTCLKCPSCGYSRG